MFGIVMLINFRFLLGAQCPFTRESAIVVEYDKSGVSLWIMPLAIQEDHHL